VTDWNQYADYLAEDAKDRRIGDHDAEVSDVEKGEWPAQVGGGIRWKIKFNLLTANGASADLTMSELPTPETLKTESPGWEDGKRRAIATSIRMREQVEKHYGVTEPDGFKRGQKYRVKTIKTKVDPITDIGGFIRVIAFLPKDGLTGAEATQPF